MEHHYFCERKLFLSVSSHPYRCHGSNTKAYLALIQISTMELFTKIVTRFKLFLLETSNTDILQGPRYHSDIATNHFVSDI